MPGSGTPCVIREPASNPTSRVVERRSLAAVPTGLVRYARAGETVRVANAPRHRAARAREVLVMESNLGRAGCGNLVANAPRKSGSRLNAAKKESSRLAIGVLRYEGFNDFKNLLLLSFRQLGNPVEGQTRP